MKEVTFFNRKVSKEANLVLKDVMVMYVMVVHLYCLDAGYHRVSGQNRQIYLLPANEGLFF